MRTVTLFVRFLPRGFLVVAMLLCGPTLALARDAVAATTKEPARTITLANGDYAPYFSEQLEHHGAGSRIVKEAFALVGIEVVYTFRPWERGLEEAAGGRWHGTVGWLKTPERETRFYYSTSIVVPRAIFFQRRDQQIEWQVFEDLSGYKIGVHSGFEYGDDFYRAEESGVFNVVRCVNDIHCLRMLMAGRLDLAAVEYDVGLYALREISDEEGSVLVEPQQKTINSLQWHLLLSRAVEGNEQLINRFNAGLKQLEESGMIDAYWATSRQGNVGAESIHAPAQ